MLPLYCHFFTDTLVGLLVSGVVVHAVTPFPSLLLLVCLIFSVIGASLVVAVAPFPPLLLLVCLLVSVIGASLFLLEVLDEVLLRGACFFL